MPLNLFVNWNGEKWDTGGFYNFSFFPLLHLHFFKKHVSYFFYSIRINDDEMVLVMLKLIRVLI